MCIWILGALLVIITGVAYCCCILSGRISENERRNGISNE